MMSNAIRNSKEALLVKALAERFIDWDVLIFHHIFGWEKARALDFAFYCVSKSADGQAYVLAGVLLLALDYPTGARVLLATLGGLRIRTPSLLPREGTRAQTASLRGP